MRKTLLKGLTLVVALGFLIGATLAAGGAPAAKKNKKNSVPAAASADAGAAKPEPTFLPATKAAMPMHFERPEAEPQQQAAPQQQQKANPK